MHVGVLQGCDRTEDELAAMKFVPATKVPIKLFATCAPARASSQGIPQRVVGIVTSACIPIEVKPILKERCIESASAAIDVDVSVPRQVGRGMGISRGKTQRKILCQPIIEAKSNSGS